MGQETPTMEFLGKLVLGLIQGVTEVFPVSSSGHLAMTRRILQDILGLEGIPFEVAVFLHFGTFIAILLFYQKDVVSLWRSSVASLLETVGQSLVRSPQLSTNELGEKTPTFLLVSLFLTGMVGLGLRPIARRWYENLLIVGGLLTLNGLVVYLTGQFSSGNRRIRDLGVWDYVIIGLAQGLSVIPGLSRFGFTLCAGLWRKMEWFEALKLSFLLSLPTVLAAGFLELAGYLPSRSLTVVEVVSTCTGVLVAAIGGYFGIRLLLSQGLHARRRLVSFGVYCIALGLFSSVYVTFLG
jgi:undecaprenyl-diphosphatase